MSNKRPISYHQAFVVYGDTGLESVLWDRETEVRQTPMEVVKLVDFLLNADNGWVPYGEVKIVHKNNHADFVQLMHPYT